MSKQRIISIGALNVDVTARVPRFAGADGEQTITAIDIHSGGQAGNIASALGRLGKQVVFWGNIGTDQHTTMLLDDLRADHVDYSYAKRTQHPNNVLYCFVDAHGDRQMYVYDHVELTAADFPATFLDAKLIIFSSLIKDDVVPLYTAIAQQAKQRGARIALDPGNILARLGLEALTPLLRLCDYVFPSEGEVALLTGDKDAVAPLTALVPHVIVTHGARGATLYQNGVPLHRSGRAATSVDTTGAGDCFAAAFLATIDDGGSPEHALDFANAAASLSIMRHGARACPHRNEIEELLHAPHHR